MTNLCQEQNDSWLTWPHPPPKKYRKTTAKAPEYPISKVFTSPMAAKRTSIFALLATQPITFFPSWILTATN